MHTMKAIKAIKTLSALFLLLMILNGCENDGDKILLSGLESNELIATESDVVLLQETSDQLVLSLVWTGSTLSISNPDMYIPDILSYNVQVSTQSDFVSNTTESPENNLSKAYSGMELNTLVKNLGAEPGVATSFYFRLKGSVGPNIDPVYSNVVKINITPYAIDMTVGFILDSKMENTGRTLYSPASNGVYTGFVGATGWYNFYLKEGDGTTWGNDGVDGSAFLLSSDEDAAKRWNFWFPGISGCYYTEVNTIKKVWSALLIPALSVSGDIDAEMVFDRPNLKWTTSFNAASARTLKVKLQGTGKQYDYSTGTDDSNAVDKAVAFSQDGQNITLSEQSGEITVTIPAAGEYSLVVDLSDPRAWKCEVVSGSTGPVVNNPYIYLPGIDDGVSGSWTFDNTLSLYNEDELAYAGVVLVNSLWGYGFYTEKDDWSNYYKMASGDAYEGTLASGANDNIPAPEAGLYLIDATLKGLKYNLTSVGDAIYVVGLHDKWEFDIPLAATETAGVYSGQITIDSASPWGFQIHLDTSWNHFFGGSQGALYYKGSNITDDASLDPGTYRMTVNLIEGTYSITK